MKSNHLRRNHSIVLKASNYKKAFFVYDIRMQNLSPKKLELKAKNKGIKGCKSMSIDKLLSMLDSTELMKNYQGHNKWRLWC